MPGGAALDDASVLRPEDDEDEIREGVALLRRPRPKVLVDGSHHGVHRSHRPQATGDGSEERRRQDELLREVVLAGERCCRIESRLPSCSVFKLKGRPTFESRFSSGPLEW